MNNLIIELIIMLVTFSSILFVDSHSIDKRSPSTEGVIIGPDTPVYYLEYPHDDYLRVNRYVNKFEASPSYNYYRIPENKSNGTFIPKVLVILDWEYLVENRAEKDILNEVLTKWNKADKYLEQLDSNPKIKLAIAGVVIPTKSDTWNKMIFNQQNDPCLPHSRRRRRPIRDRTFCDLFIVVYRIPYHPNSMAKWLNDNAGLFESFEYDLFIFMTRRKFSRKWDPNYSAYNTHMTHSKFTCDGKNNPNYDTSGGFVKNDGEWSLEAARTVIFTLGIYEGKGKDCANILPGGYFDDTWSECSKSALRSMINNTRYTCLHQIPHDQDEDDYS